MSDRYYTAAEARQYASMAYGGPVVGDEQEYRLVLRTIRDWTTYQVLADFLEESDCSAAATTLRLLYESDHAEPPPAWDFHGDDNGDD